MIEMAESDRIPRRMIRLRRVDWRNVMKTNFDQIVERQGTYSVKWMGAGGNGVDI